MTPGRLEPRGRVGLEYTSPSLLASLALLTTVAPYLSSGNRPMSAHLSPRSGSLPGMGAFCVGIAFILAATVLNVAHDRLPQFHMDKLPLYIGALYAATGKLGVTILFVSL